MRRTLRPEGPTIEGISTDRGHTSTSSRPGDELATVVAAAADGIVVVDRDGFVQYANQAAATLLGRPLDDLLMAPLGHPLEGSGTTVVDIHRRDLPLRVAEMRATPTRWHDRDAMVVLLRDVTASTLRERELASELQHRITTLASTTHELQNPLTAIEVAAGTLITHAARLDHDQRERLLGLVRRNARRASRLVNNLLLHSLYEAGALDIEPENVWVPGVLTDVAEDVEHDGIKVGVRCAEEATARCVPDHLHQILVNLLTNADKYGEPPLSIEVQQAPAHVDIAVADNGDGVPEEFVPKLFSAFSRGPDQRITEGAGLGLSITQALAELNGGSVRYEHASAGGARFVLRLPTG